MPWTTKSFRKHNKAATQAEARLGAKVANKALKSGADDGAAVRAGNQAIIDRRLSAKRGKKKSTTTD